MRTKIGSIYKLTNRYIEVLNSDDIFSKPISNNLGLSLFGMLNTYVSIPLYNYQEAIGVIFEQYESNADNSELFSKKNNCIISRISLIGTYNNFKNTFTKGIDFYPLIKSEVFSLDVKTLENIYNATISTKKPYLIIGTDLSFPSVRIFSNPNILFGKHLAIYGNTGSGKSCTVASILQSVYTNNHRLINSGVFILKTIIIDSNDEYKDIFPTIEDSVLKLDVSTLELSHKDLSFIELTELLKEDSPNVTPYLKKAIKSLKDTENVDEKIYYDFSLLSDAIRKSVPQQLNTKGVLVDDTFTLGFLKHVINRIENYVNDKRLDSIFRKKHNSIVKFLKSEKKILILSLQVPNDVLSIISYMICKSIFSIKTTTDEIKDNVLLVLEEAHRYISTSSNDLINNYYVEKLAREGRKFGINLLVSTQRPSEVSSTIISQCNSTIVHKLTSIKDLEYLRNTIEFDDKNQIESIPGLKPQNALLIGEAFAFNTQIRIADANPIPKSETPIIFIQ